MTVFVVTRFFWDDFEVIGVFRSRDAAQACVRSSEREDDQYGHEVIEMELEG